MLDEEGNSNDIIVFTVYDHTSPGGWVAEDFIADFFTSVPDDVSSLQIEFQTESRYATIEYDVFENLCECISSLQNLRTLFLNDLRLNDRHLEIFARVSLGSQLQLRNLQLGKEDKFYQRFNFSDFSLSNRLTMKAITNLLHSIAVHSPNLECFNLSNTYLLYQEEYSSWFVNGMLKLQKLSNLNMSICRLKKAGPLLYDLFSQLPSLRKVDLSACELSLSDVELVCDGLFSRMWRCHLREVAALLKLRCARDSSSSRHMKDRALVQIFTDILAPRSDGSFSIGGMVSLFLPKTVAVTTLKMDFLYIPHSRLVFPHVAKLRALECLSVYDDDSTPDGCLSDGGLFGLVEELIELRRQLPNLNTLRVRPSSYTSTDGKKLVLEDNQLCLVSLSHLDTYL
eukprot:gene30980-40310_t